MIKLDQATLDTLVKKTISGNVHGAVFHVAGKDKSVNLISAAGNLGLQDQFYIASINKLIIAALTLRLCRQNDLNLSDKISNFLSAEELRELLKFKGRDYSDQITIQHLLSHTSGLPCYLIDKWIHGEKNMQQIHRGENQAWPLEKVISEVKQVPGKFAPGTAGKASYSETNFRLLGKILSRVTGQPIEQLLTALFEELGMHDTLVLPSQIEKCAPVYYKQFPIRIDNYWASTHHDIASTAQDLMIFLKAFFSGKFYPEQKLGELEQWNKIFFPFKYGIGIQQFYIPRIMSPFKPVPKMIGHCGSVGSMAFYLPEKEIFITGTVNQTANPRLAFQALMKIITRL